MHTILSMLPDSAFLSTFFSIFSFIALFVLAIAGIVTVIIGVIKGVNYLDDNVSGWAALCFAITCVVVGLSLFFSIIVTLAGPPK
jgi:hypothetical protein